METLLPLAHPRTHLAPHSLGKLIEWKPINSSIPPSSHKDTPHSLGKLIEWKQDHSPTHPQPEPH